MSNSIWELELEVVIIKMTTGITLLLIWSELENGSWSILFAISS